MKLNPFSFLKNLFPGSSGRAARKPAPPAPKPAAPAPKSSAPAAAPSRGAKAPAAPAPPAPEGTSGEVKLPLAAVLQMLPSHLQPGVRHAQVGSRNIAVPLSLILPQLAHGDVRISFGALRQAAPFLFTHGPEEDATAIQLPLAEIVRRIDPSLLLSPGAPAGTAPTPPPAAPARPQAPAAASPKAESRSPVAAAAGSPKAEVRSPMAPAPSPVPSAKPKAAAAPAPAPAAATAPAPRQPARPAPQVPAAGSPKSDLSVSPTPRVAGPSPVGMAGSASTLQRSNAPTPPGAPSGSPAPRLPDSSSALKGAAPLVVRLGLLAAGWPEAVRLEIDQLKLAEAQVALPMELVAQGLKRGRLAFTWQTLRNWIQPAPAPKASVHDPLELELPLKEVAPLFLARQREVNKPRQKLEVGAEIPDLFVGVLPPGAASPSPAAGTSSASTSPAAPSGSPAPRVSGSSPAAAPAATPQQLVNRAVQLQGVDGALVALRDGLLVASRFPAHLNADNVAAFLPQIFGRLGQYTQELHMGELNALEFLVGKVTWKVFRQNGVFFVAFGRQGEPLPSAALAALATELGQPQ